MSPGRAIGVAAILAISAGCALEATSTSTGTSTRASATTMGDDEILRAHDAEVATILRQAEEASGGPQPTQMIFGRFNGRLSHLQGETAKKLGKTREDPELAARFAAEMRKLKEAVGMPAD